MENVNLKNETPADAKPVLAARCIYCKEGSTKKHPMLFRVYTAGEYWQHWDFENSGCEANTENISPNGDIVKRNGS